MIDPLPEFKPNLFYSIGGSVRIADLEEALAALVKKVNEVVELVNYIESGVFPDA